MGRALHDKQIELRLIVVSYDLIYEIQNEQRINFQGLLQSTTMSFSS